MSVKYGSQHASSDRHRLVNARVQLVSKFVKDNRKVTVQQCRKFHQITNQGTLQNSSGHTDNLKLPNMAWKPIA